MAGEKQRIIELQRQLKIARNVLSKIAEGHSHNEEADASDALDAMRPLDRKYPLQGIVGHK